MIDLSKLSNDSTGHAPKNKEYSVGKVNQDKKMHIARMPEHFKKDPKKNPSTKKSEGKDLKDTVSDLNFRDRKILLTKKAKLNDGKAKNIEPQYLLEDQDDKTNDVPASYTGTITKTDALHYLFIRIDDDIKLVPVTSLISFRKDMKIESRSLEDLSKRRRKNPDVKETTTKKDKKGGKAEGEKSESDESASEEAKSKKSEEGSDHFSDLMQSDDDGPPQPVQPQVQQVQAQDPKRKVTTDKTPTAKGKQVAVIEPQKGILASDGSDSLANDDDEDSDLSFDDA